MELTGKERELKPSEIISTRSDTRGVITYVNSAFTAVSGYSREEALGKPHLIIRHPDMPRAVYFLMWQALKSGEEFFGVTKNRCKNGDHYWACGSFQPDKENGELIGYRSTRQGLIGVGKNALKREFDRLYREVREVELAQPRPQQIEAGLEALTRLLKKRGHAGYEDYARRAL
ncbi:MAG: PAS domain-containing protein [Pseudomonadota bacterium]